LSLCLYAFVVSSDALMAKNCDQCGAENLDAANFCSRCGFGFGRVPIRSATRVTPVMQQWRQMSQKLTRKEVRKLLGEALRIDVNHEVDNTTVEKWTYEYESVGNQARPHGVVVFDVAESRILAWTEPDWAAFGERAKHDERE